jgi:Zn-dependent M16 (insulinase) family peptidase
VRNHLLEGSIYAKCGGGIPDNILDANYEDVLGYMKNYLTISNSM